MDAFDAQALTNDLLGGDLDGAAGENSAGEDEGGAGGEVAERSFHGVGAAGEIEDDVGFEGFGCGGTELCGQGGAGGIVVDDGDLCCAEVAGHGAGGEAEHASAEDEDFLVGDVAGLAEGGGDGGGGAVGGAGDGVRNGGGDFDESGACGEEAVFGEASGEVGGGRDGGVAEFEEVFAFGVEVDLAHGAVAAGPDHGPGDAVAGLKIGIVGGFDEADHFVAEDGGSGGVAATGVGVEVAAANGGASDADEGFAFARGGDGERFDGEGLIGGVEDGGAGVHF